MTDTEPSPARETDRETMLRIDRVFDEVSRFERFGSSRAGTKAGSALDLVENSRLVYPTAGIVGVALASAADGLLACAHVWRGNGRRTLPVAMGTLLRQSILGSATTLWVCEPEVLSELQRRYAGISLRTLQNSLGAWKALRDDATPGDGHHERFSQSFQDAQRRIDAIAKGPDRLARTTPPSDTDLWKQAIEAVYADGADRRAYDATAWHLYSGDAHSQLWAPSLRTEMREYNATLQGLNRPIEHGAMMGVKELSAGLRLATNALSVAGRRAIRRGFRVSRASPNG